MAAMSAQSRYQRFHAPKSRLTRSERAHLTNVDEEHHIAAIALADDGSPVGVARVLRLGGHSASGEVAVAVVDAWQGRGVGQQLLANIRSRACAMGLQELVAMVLSGTRLVRSLERRGWKVHRRDGTVTTLVTPTCCC
jgi:N-acetylglutamate synthase-like GNAT family acetyltransferase